MSSADGRYQSRLFRFVHKQSRRFTSSCDRAWRNLQVTASWVAAVGMYPLVLLFVSTRSTANQIHQAVQQTLPQLLAPETDAEPLCVDTPIQQVLFSIDALSAESAISTPSHKKPEPLKNIPAFLAFWRLGRNISRLGDKRQNNSEFGIWNSELSRPSIQGIATQLSSQTLVLVTAQNEILDILTSTQQEKLQAQIITAIADEGRYQRLAHSSTTALGAKENYQLPTTNYQLPTTNYQLPNPVLGFLDRTIAVVESNYEVPVKSLAITLFSTNQNGGLVGRIQTRLGVLSKGKSVAIASNSSSTTDTMRIPALIRAAIDYFFGTRARKPLEQTTPKSDFTHHRPNFPQTAQRVYPSLNSTNSQTQAKQLKGRSWAAKLSSAKLSSAHLPPGSHSVNSGIEDPWLSESDLFGESVTTENLTGHQQQQRSSKTKLSGQTMEPVKIMPAERVAGGIIPNAISHLFKRSLVRGQYMEYLAGIIFMSSFPGSRNLVGGATKYSLRNLANSFGILLQPKPASEIVKRQKINNGKLVAGISTKQSPPLFKSPRQDTADEIFAQTSNSNTQIKPAPDWIETNATAMGYVKHPLEQLLAWLDRAMLWLEEVLLKIWQGLKRG